MSQKRAVKIKLWLFKKLVTELMEEPGLSKKRINAKKMKKMYDVGLACAITDANGESIVACGFLYKTKHKGILEFGTLFVSKREFRKDETYRQAIYGGFRLSEIVLMRCADIIRQRDYQAVMFTALDKVADLATHLSDEYKWKSDKEDCGMARCLVRPKMAKPEGVPNTHFLYLL